MILDMFKSQPEPKTPFPRCEHRSPAGRQCSQPVCSTSPHFCFTHKPQPEELTIAELTEAAGTLSTPEEIHRFLIRVTLLRIQDRITPKEACAYVYLCQILQRGQHEIAWHQQLREERQEREAEQARREEVLSWSIRRPNRDDPPSSTNPAPAAPPSAPHEPVVSKSEKAEPAPPCPTKGGRARKSSESASSPSVNSSIPPDFYNHFHPIDPTLPPGLQDPRKNIPPPDETECARINARRGFAPPRLYRKATSRLFGLWQGRSW